MVAVENDLFEVKKVRVRKIVTLKLKPRAENENCCESLDSDTNKENHFNFKRLSFIKDIS
jgi:hypothetical protein